MEIVVPNHFANLRVSSELFHLLDDARHVLHVFPKPHNLRVMTTDVKGIH